nr:mannosylglucosyl-3-phosphoglycerate phosphatase [Quercus suber]
MVPALNSLRTTAACLGNHDLDFGVQQFQLLAGMCDFPWLCANVLDPALGSDVPLGNCKRSVMITASNGIRIGVIGLVEQEWLDTINTLPPDLRFVEPAIVARELAAKLRHEGAEMIIALTHQRQPNDEKLARELEPGVVDIILSGHDHFYAQAVVNGTQVLRSGTDFKQLSYLEVRRKKDGTGWEFDIWRRDVISMIPPEPAAVAMVDKITSNLRTKLEKPIGYSAVPLDARFTTVRLKESNMGNFICDLMRLHYNADCCIMAAGTIRGDQVYLPGLLKVKDIMNCFPFEDPCVVVGVTGKQLLHALENGVSKYPAQEGRFPQVSNITFKFDPSKTEGHRCSDVKVGGQPIALEREYSLATRDYMVRGKDGFHSLVLEGHGGTARSIVDEENGMLLSMILRQYFISLKVLGNWRGLGHHFGRHWNRVQDALHEVHPVREPVSSDISGRDHTARASQKSAGESAEGVPSLVGKAQQRQDIATAEQMDHTDSEDEHVDASATYPRSSQHDRDLMIMRKAARKWWRRAGMEGHPSLAEEDKETVAGVSWTKGICPRVEGRIVMIGDNAHGVK